MFFPKGTGKGFEYPLVGGGTGVAYSVRDPKPIWQYYPIFNPIEAILTNPQLPVLYQKEFVYDNIRTSLQRAIAEVVGDIQWTDVLWADLAFNGYLLKTVGFELEAETVEGGLTEKLPTVQTKKDNLTPISPEEKVILGQKAAQATAVPVLDEGGIEISEVNFTYTHYRFYPLPRIGSQGARQDYAIGCGDFWYSMTASPMGLGGKLLDLDNLLDFDISWSLYLTDFGIKKPVANRYALPYRIDFRLYASAVPGWSFGTGAFGGSQTMYYTTQQPQLARLFVNRPTSVASLDLTIAVQTSNFIANTACVVTLLKVGGGSQPSAAATFTSVGAFAEFTAKLTGGLTELSPCDEYTLTLSGAFSNSYVAVRYLRIQ